MSQEYWEELYQQGDTRWEKGEPSPGLVDFLESSHDLSKGTVLVPGCGSGHDVRAWAKHGFAATGLDIAPSAIRLSKEKSVDSGLQVDFRLGNFLHDTPFARFDYLFEHTLFCAIRLEDRDEYVQAARKWLKPGGTFVAVFYLINDVDGPPFGSTREEIRQRFDPFFEMKTNWVPRSYPNRTGLEWMTIWSPKAKGMETTKR